MLLLFWKCCLELILRLWLEADQFPLLNLHPTISLLRFSYFLLAIMYSPKLPGIGYQTIGDSPSASEPTKSFKLANSQRACETWLTPLFLPYTSCTLQLYLQLPYPLLETLHGPVWHPSELSKEFCLFSSGVFAIKGSLNIKKRGQE